MRRQLPLAITFITGVLIVVAFFIPHKPMGDLDQRLLIWYSIILGFTLAIGLDSLVRHHLLKIQHRQEGWGYSIVLLAGLVASLVLGFYSWAKFKTPLELHSPFMYFYRYFIIPLQSTMFAILAFFIASAAYRAFRARTFEATLLLVAAILVMLGRVRLGQWVWDYSIGWVWNHATALIGFKHLAVTNDFFARICDWIMEIPQLAAKRGISVGVALGGIAMSIRVILGIERTYLA
jgi:hypothetical protein